MNIRVLFEIMYSTDSNSVIINSSYVSLYKLKQTILGADRKTNYVFKRFKNIVSFR